MLHKDRVSKSPWMVGLETPLLAFGNAEQSTFAFTYISTPSRL